MTPSSIRKLSWTFASILMLSVVTNVATATDLSGEWKGTWKSCETGHQGPLKATFCRVDSCHYRVTFCGRFFKLLPFRYTVTLRVVSEGDKVVLQGSQKLGRLLGVYRYQATASPCVFHANYSSKDDRGYFHLERR